MTNSGIWKPMMAPVCSTKFFVVWTLSLFTNSFCHTISSLSEIPSRYSTNLFTRLHDITSPWPGHKLARLDVISPSGPSDICPSRGWTNPASWYILLNISPLHTWVAPLWSPCYGVTVDTVKASSDDSDRIIISRSKDSVTITFLLSYRNADVSWQILLR